jgi:predicted acylesterase/phospholipase RssA
MKKEMVHIGISAAGFAIPGIGGGVYELLRQGVVPDIISGVSSGAILAFILCASSDPMKTIETRSIGFNSKDVFSKPPFNKKGNITFSSGKNALLHNYLSEQDNLFDLLRSVVSADEWDLYLSDPNSPDVIIMAVDFLTGSRVFEKLKDYCYEDAIKLVVASSSIPVFVNPIDFDGKVLYDGGVRNHILTEWVFDNYPITKSYSIFSRSKDFKKHISRSELSTIIKVLFRTVEIMENEISKSDEQLADLKAESIGITHKNFYIKNILDNVYDDDLEKQRELFEFGKKQVRDNF